MSQQLPSYLQEQGQLYRLNKARVRSMPSIDNAIGWIEENFYIPETPDHRFRLAPYQKRVLSEALRRDESGNYVYSTVIWSDIKKSLKSCVAAALALYDAYRNDWSTIYVIANDLKQAESRVAYYIRRAIELNPRMKAECRVKNYLTELPNYSRIEAIPIDPTGEAGGNADRLIFSELWGWKHEDAKRMWTEQTLSPTKFGKSQRWVETYAGYVGESPILESLYDRVVKEKNRIDSDIELYRDGQTLALWNTQPRHEFQSVAYYASEAENLTPNEFQRVHHNQWLASTEAFVPVEWWDACKSDMPEFGRHTPIVIALDAAVTGDCFGLVGVSRVKGKTYPRFIYKWTPPLHGQIDFNEPRLVLEQLSRDYNVECAVADPYQLTYFMQQQIERGVIYMLEFPQAGKRLEADKALYDAIRERTIAHDGNIDLREHILNANRKAADDNKLRIVKRQESLKIDLAVCLSMAHHTAIELELN